MTPIRARSVWSARRRTSSATRWRQVASGVDIEIELVDFDDREAATTAVRDGDVDAAVVLDVDPVGIVIDTDDDAQLEALLRQTIGITSVVDSLADAGLTRGEIEAAFDTSEPTVEVLDTERGGRRAPRSRISIVLYVMLLLLTSQVASGVAIEKTNSVSEVLLAIVRPHALLFGKVIGVGLIGVFTLACGALPVLVKLAAGGSLPPGIAGTLAGGAAFFVIGVALYLTTGGALGALVGRQEEAAAAVAPLSVMLIAFYIVGQGGADTTLGAVLAYVPVRRADGHAGAHRAWRVVAVRDRGVADDRGRHGLPGRAAVSGGVPACDRAHRSPPQAARRAASAAALTTDVSRSDREHSGGEVDRRLGVEQRVEWHPIDEHSRRQRSGGHPGRGRRVERADQASDVARRCRLLGDGQGADRPATAGKPTTTNSTRYEHRRGRQRVASSTSRSSPGPSRSGLPRTTANPRPASRGGRWRCCRAPRRLPARRGSARSRSRRRPTSARRTPDRAPRTCLGRRW